MTSDKFDAKEIDAIKQPVSIEELYDTLVELTPILVRRGYANKRDALKEWVRRLLPVFRHIARVEWMFEDDELTHDIERWMLQEVLCDDERGAAGDRTSFPQDTENAVQGEHSEIFLAASQLSFNIQGPEAARSESETKCDLSKESSLFRRKTSPASDADLLPETNDSKLVEPLILGKCI
eukprot:gnl/TRDRNA2_/TRDRNA2_124493_c0_seq1.p1 gnl/TRDRNA2_/TRDRNA2_124493_c0~~gnl/TRDRNA2_/TRDRNA2_124493_c0_seq1.p1  ORF type:complete len:205 (-),score=26.63 gnl/TRDRNA2_/TRDRNA2_124493_c0_seq1:15-554(-)